MLLSGVEHFIKKRIEVCKPLEAYVCEHFLMKLVCLHWVKAENQTCIIVILGWFVLVSVNFSIKQVLGLKLVLGQVKKLVLEGFERDMTLGNGQVVSREVIEDRSVMEVSGLIGCGSVLVDVS